MAAPPDEDRLMADSPPEAETDLFAELDASAEMARERPPLHTGDIVEDPHRTYQGPPTPPPPRTPHKRHKSPPPIAPRKSITARRLEKAASNRDQVCIQVLTRTSCRFISPYFSGCLLHPNCGGTVYFVQCKRHDVFRHYPRGRYSDCTVQPYNSPVYSAHCDEPPKTKLKLP